MNSPPLFDGIIPSTSTSISKPEPPPWSTCYAPKPPSLLPSRPRPSSTSDGHKTSFGSRKKWLVHSGKILRFFAYYNFPLTSNLYGGSSIRKVIIFYYLEDDTIAVMEPPEANSGFTSGMLVKRGSYPNNNSRDDSSCENSKALVPSSSPCSPPQPSLPADSPPPPSCTAARPQPSSSSSSSSQQAIHPNDLRVGETLTLNGITFHIYDADKFTRSYLPDLQPAMACPTGMYKAGPLVAKVTTTPCLLPGAHMFAVHNPGREQPPLIFYCSWDETWREHGAVHRYTLVFFTEDGTLELREVLPPASSYDMPALVLRRQRILKAKMTSRSGVSIQNSDHIGSQKFFPEDCYVGLEDLQIGKTTRIGSRDLKIEGAPPKTLDYLHARYGPTAVPVGGDGTSTVDPRLWSTPQPSPSRSLISSRKTELLLRFHKGALYHGKVFRFLGKPAGGKPNDHEPQLRCSILYYLERDEVSIHVTAPRNSGIPGGDLLKRSKVINPDTGRPYGCRDFQVGNVIKLRGCFDIEITAAEEEYHRFLARMRSPHPSPSLEQLLTREGPVSDEDLDEALSETNNRHLRRAEDRELARAMGCIQGILCDNKGVGLVIANLTKRAALDAASGRPSRCVPPQALLEALKAETPLTDRGWAALGKKFPPLATATTIDFHTFLRLMERYQLARHLGRHLLTYM